MYYYVLSTDDDHDTKRVNSDPVFVKDKLCNLYDKRW